jgi:hypothetical protein
MFVNRESLCTVCTEPLKMLELKIFFVKGDITALYRWSPLPGRALDDCVPDADGAPVTQHSHLNR